MINLIRNAYQIESSDVYGDFLIKPLKSYHGFFAKRIENSSLLGKLALLITNIATGIFAYPIFGALASFGILIKLIGIYFVQKHNDAEKARIEKIEIPYMTGSEAQKWADKTRRLLYISSKEQAIGGDTITENEIRNCRTITGEFQVIGEPQDAFHRNYREIIQNTMAIIDDNSRQFKKVYVAIGAISYCRFNACCFTLYNRIS